PWPADAPGLADVSFPRREGRTLSGTAVSVSCLLLGLSGLGRWRLSIAGLYSHPYLFILAPALVLLGWRLVARFPARVAAAVVPFFALFVLSCLRDEKGFATIVRITSSVLTVFAAAVLVRTRKDFTGAVAAMSVSVAALGLQALVTQDYGVQGLEVGDVGNK